MVKLRASLAEAGKLATKRPNCYKVGASGWVTVPFSHDESPPPGLLERGIDESYRLVVHKQLVAMLPDRGFPAAGSTKTAKQKTAKRKRKRKRKLTMARMTKGKKARKSPFSVATAPGSSTRRTWR